MQESFHAQKLKIARTTTPPPKTLLFQRRTCRPPLGPDGCEGCWRARRRRIHRASCKLIRNRRAAAPPLLSLGWLGSALRRREGGSPRTAQAAARAGEHARAPPPSDAASTRASARGTRAAVSPRGRRTQRRDAGMYRADGRAAAERLARRRRARRRVDSIRQAAAGSSLLSAAARG